VPTAARSGNSDATRCPVVSNWTDDQDERSEYMHVRIDAGPCPETDCEGKVCAVDGDPLTCTECGWRYDVL